MCVLLLLRASTVQQEWEMQTFAERASSHWRTHRALYTVCTSRPARVKEASRRAMAEAAARSSPSCDLSSDNEQRIPQYSLAPTHIYTKREQERGAQEKQAIQELVVAHKSKAKRFLQKHATSPSKSRVLTLNSQASSPRTPCENSTVQNSYVRTSPVSCVTHSSPPPLMAVENAYVNERAAFEEKRYAARTSIVAAHQCRKQTSKTSERKGSRRPCRRRCRRARQASRR